MCGFFTRNIGVGFVLYSVFVERTMCCYDTNNSNAFKRDVIDWDEKQFRVKKNQNIRGFSFLTTHSCSW
jgi:hypothetical protein